MSDTPTRLRRLDRYRLACYQGIPGAVWDEQGDWMKADDVRAEAKDQKDKQAACVKEIGTLTAMLEQQRHETYQAVAREHTAKRALAAMTQERDSAERNEHAAMLTIDEVERRRNETVAMCTQLQGELAASEARVKELEEHQQLHDRVFCRQKMLHESLRATVKNACEDLSQWHSNEEHSAPYDSRPQIVRGVLEKALEGYFETSERDTLKARVTVLEEALKDIIDGLPVHGYSLPILEWVREYAAKALATGQGKEKRGE